MSKFEGNKFKVRCTDCSHLSDNKCARKGVSVSPKKRRICSLYDFKGEYANRESLPSSYVPHMDKKTRRMVRKLLNMGVVPVDEGGDVMVDEHGQVLQKQSFTAPRSTASAAAVGLEEKEQTKLASPDEESLIWTPDKNE